jgi:hypothetical protein
VWQVIAQRLIALHALTDVGFSEKTNSMLCLRSKERSIIMPGISKSNKWTYPEVSSAIAIPDLSWLIAYTSCSDTSSGDPEVRSLSKRVEYLERVVSEMRRSRRETSSFYESADDLHQMTTASGRNETQRIVAHSKAPSLEDNQAALAIEDIALNRTSNQRLDDLPGAAG